MPPPPYPARRRLLLVGVAAMLAAELAFAALMTVAMFQYPGGNYLDRAAVGHRFWSNFMCDLAAEVALDGRPIPLHGLVAQAAMVTLAVAMALLWWVLPAMFPARPRLGGLVRGAGTLSFLGSVAVVLTPSSRYGGAAHGVAILTAAVPVLVAGVASLAAQARDEPPPRVAAAVGMMTLVATLLTLGLYIRQLALGGETPALLPASQRVALLGLLAWMALCALRVIAPPTVRRSDGT
jgi:hypothetical protein